MGEFSNAKYKIAQLERGRPVQYVLGLLGDSWTQHSWNEKINDYMPAHTNYVQPLTKYLREMYGDAGGGFYSFSTSHGGQAKMMSADSDDADDTRGGSITYRDQIEGVKCVDAADATFNEDSWLKLNVKRPHNLFVIHFFGGSEAGVFTYSIDGGEAVEVDASEYEGHSTISVTVPLDMHEIDFEVTSGSVMLFGVDMQRNNPGVRVHKIGNKGAYSYSYVNVDTDCWKPMIQSLDMDSITILLGINDGAGSLNVGENIVEIIENIKDVNPYIDTCVIAPSNTRSANYYNVSRQCKEAAINTHSKFIDLIPLFDTSANITAKYKFYDSLHPTLSGGKAIADHLIQELFPTPTRFCDFSKTMLSVPFEINRHKCIKTNGTVNENTDQYDIWRYEVVPGDYYLIDAYRDAEQTTYVVNWMDEGGNFIDHELQNTSTTSDLTWEEFIVKAPGNAKYLFLNVRSGYNSKHNVKTLSDGCISSLKGKKIAVIGDSISTNGKTGEDSNVPEIVIQSEDVGVSLSAYITATDVADGLSINGTTYTSSDIGTKATFTPALADIGKKVGVPLNYNSNSVKTWWEWMKDYFECDVIPVCWSGSSITSHEGNKNDYKASYAWHESQITKCGVRTPGTMDRTAPDMIIIYRGTNDMTHTSGSTSPFTPDVVLTDDYFKGIVTCPANDSVSGGYGFKEAYYKTISALRAAYPKAEIVLCTLSPFKRIHYGQFPTNNGVNSIPDYNNAIREIAEYMGCRVIEFDKAGITFENMYPTYISDSSTIPTHPNDFGHLMLGKCAIERMKL
jgi:lysophospholipase L1-like esterase